MSGTFVETPSKALTIEHELVGRALTQFKPEEVRSDLDKIDVLAVYGAKLRDDTKLYELAVRKLEVIVDIVEWVEQHIQPVGGDRIRNAPPRADGKLSVSKIMELLGFQVNENSGCGTLFRWRKLAAAAKKDTDATIDKMVLAWKVRAGMAPVSVQAKKKEIDYDLAVEMIFRAYIKLDPDQRIELKQKIMAFEKSYKDPFAPKAA